MAIQKILITGAAGYLAQFIIERLNTDYQLTLSDIVAPSQTYTGTTFIKTDVTQLSEIETACKGQDAVIHLVAFS